jgi:protein-tyrosine-phosphatase
VLKIASAPTPKGVLFLCRDNGARSLMAEAILNNFAGGDMRAYSAGVEPPREIALPILQVIESRSVSIKQLRPKRWNEFDGIEGRKLDFVFSICDPNAGEACAYWPGQPLRAHWHIPEPREGGNINEYYRMLDETYELIFRCVNGFLNLPLEVMQKFALSRESDGNPFVPDHLRLTLLPARVPTAS